MRYETYSHTADAGVRGYGSTVSEAFEGVAMATFSLMADIDKVNPKIKTEIKLKADSLEVLLVKWLNELISLASLNSMVYSKFQVEVDDKKFALNAKIWGNKINETSELREEVKAATFADLRVEKIDDEWVAQCIVDVRSPLIKGKLSV